MNHTRLRLLIGLGAVLFLGASCSLTGTSSAQPGIKDVSLYLSDDSGDTWQPMVNVPVVSGKPRDIANINVNRLAIDPSDSRAIYLASLEGGLYYTYNVKEGWNFVAGLPKETISDVKVDPQNKCIIYAAISNRLYRSNDCTRTWTQAYFDNNNGVSVTSIAVDHYNSQNIYIGTSRGEIIKSIDGGQSWRTIQRLDNGVDRLIISPLDSRQLFVATGRNKIFSFTSSSDTSLSSSGDSNFLVNDWTDLNAVLKDFELGANFQDIVVSSDGLIFLATDKVLLKSVDNGISWEKISLIQPEDQAAINAIAVNPKNSQDIYYVTNTTFFRSTDGGITWQTKKLPTQRSGRVLLIDFVNPNNIYLGTAKLKN